MTEPTKWDMKPWHGMRSCTIGEPEEHHAEVVQPARPCSVCFCPYEMSPAGKDRRRKELEVV